MLIDVAGEVDLGLLGGEGAGWEAAVVKLGFVIVDICHRQRDPYAHLGLLPIDVAAHLGGLRAEQRPQGSDQRTNAQEGTEIQGQKLRVGVQKG